MRVVGVMSGTSADGVDAALLEVDPQGLRLVEHWSCPYPEDLRQAVIDANGPLTVEAMARLDRRLGLFYGAWLRGIFDTGGSPALVALHGQTVRHQPDGEDGFSLQIGCPEDVARLTGCTVLSQFRMADVVWGGQGAPLVPPFHQALFAGREPRLVLNLGGMANITWLPPPDDPRTPLAFDTGPGNVLLDACAAIVTGGRLACDRDGLLAARGQVREDILRSWLAWPYFHRPPPKSTGRELFGVPMARRLHAEWEGDGADLLATLAALTARSVIDAVRRWTPGARTMLVFGGGARNPAVMAQLRSAGSDLDVVDGEAETSIPGQALEAMAFAWLGWRCVLGLAGNLPSATGAAAAVPLGRITPGANWPSLLRDLAG